MVAFCERDHWEAETGLRYCRDPSLLDPCTWAGSSPAKYPGVGTHGPYPGTGAACIISCAGPVDNWLGGEYGVPAPEQTGNQLIAFEDRRMNFAAWDIDLFKVISPRSPEILVSRP